MKLSATERQILEVLHFQAQTPLAEVARHVGIHHNTVIRALDRLREHGVIRPSTRVNIRALGYKVFSVWCSLTSLGTQRLPQLVQHLQSCPHVIWAVTVCGDYDLFIDFAVFDDGDVENHLSELTQKQGAVFSKTCILRSAYWYIFPKQYYFDSKQPSTQEIVRFADPTTNSPYDMLDLKLLEALSKNPVATQRLLGEELDTPVQTVNYRLSRLHRT
jgi:DNA-binding Lrp family transcriptional regulator